MRILTWISRRRGALGIACVGLLVLGVAVVWFRPTPQERARLDELAAVRLLDEGAPARAEIHFRRVLQVTPESSRTWLGLARALRGQERDDEARAALDKALELAPQWEDAQVASAQAWMDGGKPDRALAALRPSFEGSGPSAAVLRTRATVLRANGDFTGALRDLKHLADSTGELADGLLSGLAHLMFADEAASDSHREIGREMLRDVVRRAKPPRDAATDEIVAVASAALSADPLPVPAPGAHSNRASGDVSASRLRVQGLAAFAEGDTAETGRLAASALRASPGSTASMRLLAASALAEGRDALAGRLVRASGAAERLSSEVPVVSEASDAEIRRAHAVGAGRRLAAGFLEVPHVEEPESVPPGPLGAVAHAAELLRASDPRGALACLERAGSAPDARRLRAAALGSLGLWDEAVEALDHDDPAALTGHHLRALAHALVRAGDVDRAVDVVADVLPPFDGPGGDLDGLPESGRRRLRLARLLERRGDLRAAAGVYRQVAQDSPTFRVSRLAFASCLLRAGHAQKVEREWARRQETAPRDPVPPFLRACAAQSLGEPRRAEALYRRSVSLDPDFAVAANNLAWLLSECLNDPKEALGFARAAAVAAPDDPRIADTLGRVLFRSGDFAGAVRALARAARGRPQDAGIALRRAEALSAAGNRAAADAEWRRARALDPAAASSPRGRALRARLDEETQRMDEETQGKGDE